jgi:hypothetical protein
MVQRKKQTTKATQLKSVDWTTLKGKFFHNFDKDGYVQNQGQIVELVGDDIAIVLLFSWVMGEPTYHKAFWVKDIVDGRWALYSTDEEMREAHEIGFVKSRPIKN